MSATATTDSAAMPPPALNKPTPGADRTSATANGTASPAPRIDTAAPTSSTPIQPVDSAASGTSSVMSSNTPLPTPIEGSLIAVAFHALDPSTKQHHIKPAVCTSKPTLSHIASNATSASGAADGSPAVTDAYNAAIDLVNHLEGQLSRPPNLGETFTSLVRPASKEMESRIKKAEKKIGRGDVEIPGKMQGWNGTRRVVGCEWSDFERVFGKN